MNSKHLLMMLVLVPCLASAKGNQGGYDAQYKACLRELGPISNGVVTACAEGISSKAKSEMNSLYATLHREYLVRFPDDADNLEKSQKTWLSYRTLHCAIAGRRVGSPMNSVCPMTLNIQRVKELRALSNGL